MKCFNCGQDGHISPDCPWHPELADELLLQFTRCRDCKAIIYMWDKGIPCARHRLVAEWRAYYHSPRFAADVAEYQAARPGHEPPPDRQMTAAQQVSESRSTRQVMNP